MNAHTGRLAPTAPLSVAGALTWALGGALVLAVCLASAPRASSQQITQQQNQQGAVETPSSQGNNGPYLTEGRRYINPNLQRYPNQTAAEVQEAIATLSDYTAFDNIEFTMNAQLNEVTLDGQVVNPALARDAENIVRSIPGVVQVTNRLQILPSSERDDQLRQTVYRAIYDNAKLSGYRGETNPPIHIIVADGKVTLVGVVGDANARAMAYQQAAGLPGVESARNDLVIDPYAVSVYLGESQYPS